MAESSARMRIPDEDRAILLSWARSFSVPAGAALRACIVLASAQGAGHLAGHDTVGGLPPGGDRLAGALPRRRDRGPGRCAALGAAHVGLFVAPPSMKGMFPRSAFQRLTMKPLNGYLIFERATR